jgi:hypothetical protein
LHTPLLPELARVARDQYLRGSLADEGADPATRVRNALERGAILTGQFTSLAAALEVHGLFDRRGRLRVSWLSTLESLANALLAIDRLLGWERKTRDINALDVSPAEWLESLDRRVSTEPSTSTTPTSDPIESADARTLASHDNESAPTASEDRHG